MKKLLTLVSLLFASLPAHGQNGNTVLIRFPGVPSGDCSDVMVAVNDSNGDYYDCFLGAWFKIGPGGGGGVASVTGTLPISSSGGANPDISITQAGVASDGYLSSIDWGTFNGKQPALTTHACGAGDFVDAFTAPNTFTCATPSGSGSQHQVNGVNLTSNNPVNFVDGTITFSNPSAGNITASCPTCLTGFPRLDQVLDPTADKPFVMTTKLGFLYTAGSAESIPFEVKGTDTVLTYFGPNKASFTTDAQAFLAVTPHTFASAAETNNVLALGETTQNSGFTNGLMGVAFASGNDSQSVEGIVAQAESYGVGDSKTLIGLNASAGHHGSGAGATLYGAQIYGCTIDGTSTGSRCFGVAVDDQSAGATNYGVYVAGNSAANKWAYYGAGTAASHFGGTTDAPVFNATTGFQVSGAAAAGKVLIGDGTNFTPGDPMVQGLVANDAPDTSNPVLVGGYAKATAPTNVSADGDAVNTWHLLNGSPVVNLATGGTLYDARSIRALTSSDTVTAVSGTASNLKTAATLDAETTKVIGTVRTADGTGNLLTTNSTTYTAKFGLDSNLLGTLGTAFSTAGFVDVKGADGNVFVRQTTGTNLHAVIDTGSTTAVTQATGTNLHAVIDSGSTTAVTQATGTNLHAVTDSGSVTAATLSAETTKVIGTVRVLGNAGAIVDGATGAAPPANVVYVGGVTSGATAGLLTGIPVCDSYANINVSTAATTLIITGVASRTVHICAINMVTNAAQNVTLIQGTGATCGTSTTSLAGGTTNSTGYQFAANGGLTMGSGIGNVMLGDAAGKSVCIITSGATQLSGGISYAIY
jgi:hypothetical protein